MIPLVNLEKRTINGQNVRFLSYTETGCDAWPLYVDEDGVVWLAGSDIWINWAPQESTWNCKERAVLGAWAHHRQR